LSLAEKSDFAMTSVPPIVLPDEFNAAAYFIDRHIAQGRGAKVAIECGDIQISYCQLLERVNQLGNGLRNLGVRIEERVLLLLLDTPEFAISFFGAIKIGAIPVPVNTLLKPADYTYLLNNSRARRGHRQSVIALSRPGHSQASVALSGDNRRCRHWAAGGRGPL
jgi:non-ribosomal peptide synthetase component E (peptide arylation enzyme)